MSELNDTYIPLYQVTEQYYNTYIKPGYQSQPSYYTWYQAVCNIILSYHLGVNKQAFNAAKYAVQQLSYNSFNQFTDSYLSLQDKKIVGGTLNSSLIRFLDHRLKYAPQVTLTVGSDSYKFYWVAGGGNIKANPINMTKDMFVIHGYYPGAENGCWICFNKSGQCSFFGNGYTSMSTYGLNFNYNFLPSSYPDTSYLSGPSKVTFVLPSSSRTFAIGNISCNDFVKQSGAEDASFSTIRDFFRSYLYNGGTLPTPDYTDYAGLGYYKNSVSFEIDFDDILNDNWEVRNNINYVGGQDWASGDLQLQYIDENFEGVTAQGVTLLAEKVYKIDSLQCTFKNCYNNYYNSSFYSCTRKSPGPNDCYLMANNRGPDNKTIELGVFNPNTAGANYKANLKYYKDVTPIS